MTEPAREKCDLSDLSGGEAEVAEEGGVTPHRCACCLDELQAGARRFVVFIPEPHAVLPDIDLATMEIIASGREEVVCEACVGWYHDGSMEVEPYEVGL